MKILLLASGSGGHVYPCLSFIKEARNEELIYLTIKNGFESKVNIDVQTLSIDVANQLKTYIKSPKNLIKLRQELKKHAQVFKEVDAILCFGGFVSFIGYLIAIKYHKPLYIHEQNYVLGDANKFVSHKAKKVFLSFPNPNYQKDKFMIVGNPRMDECQKSNSHNRNFKVLLFAGSLSSSSLNVTFSSLLKMNFPSNIELYFISGKKQYEEYKKYEKTRIHIIAYQEKMLELMKEMDLVIMRAGATSLSEVIALNKPSILIPSPNVKHDHQRQNARFLVNNEAAIMIEEKDAKAETLFENILALSKDYERIYIFKKNLNKLVHQDVTKNMLKEIKNG